MRIVALTGGIAAGKSTIGDLLAELGAIRIDADQLAREAVQPGSPGLARIVERFGAGVLTENGELNRPELGKIVFADAEALADLNGIVHPEVQRLLDSRIDAVEGTADIVVYEIPLLVESGAQAGRRWDLIVTAEAPVETRIARMQELRGMNEDAARARIANQASEAERRSIADVVIETGGTPEETRSQVAGLWARLTRGGSPAGVIPAETCLRASELREPVESHLGQEGDHEETDQHQHPGPGTQMREE